MPKLSISADLSREHLDLLEAVGFETDQDLAEAEASVVHRELIKANDMLSLARVVPALEEVEGWIDSLREPSDRHSGKSRRRARKKTAREATGSHPEDGGEDAGGPVNYEADPDVQEMLARAPFAVPIPNRMLAEAGIHPSEIEVAVMLNRAESDLEVDVSLSGSSSRGDPKLTPKRRPSGLVHVADSRLGERLGIDVSRVKKVEEAAANPTPRPRVNVDERTQLIRTAREETNRGKDPKSRRFVRGVLHDRPFFVRLGCWIVLAFQLSIPLAILAAPLVMLADGQGPGYEWIPSWVVAFPLALPLLGILYFTLSYRVKCRVCGQRVLAPRQCLKNRKAHHIPLLGHIVALALHTVLFHWFNCTYCGTSVRVKE